MSPLPFQYVEPLTLESALVELAVAPADTTLVAGGTSVVLLHRLGLLRPSRVVGLRRVAELQGIHFRGDSVTLGATVTHHEVAMSSEISRQFPSLAQACRDLGNVRIRNQGTIGGNVAHADPAQDPPPVLISLDASIHVASQGVTRAIRAEKFFVDYFTTLLKPSELVTAVSIPINPSLRASYLRFLPRTQSDYAAVSVAAAIVESSDGTVELARIALGSVGPTPIRATSVEAGLLGNRLTPEVIASVTGSLGDEIDPIDDPWASAEYKRRMATVVACRALDEIRTATRRSHDPDIGGD